MKRQGDIDGVLEAWFLDGPLEMPDRLFDAVFDQVERVSQRRLARLRLRFTDMSPTARLLVVAGATILLLGVGAAAIGAINPKPSTAPDVPSPSATPAASADAAVVASLRYQFLGPHRTEAPAPAGEDRSTLTFDDASFNYNGNLLRSSAATAGPTRIRLVSENVAGGCAVGDEGLYDWSSTPGETKVTFTLVSDDCDARSAVVPGEWLRSNCADDSDNCIGPLEAETYASVSIDPWVAAGEAWRPRYGAVTYTVPAGWENPADWPSEYKLKPLGTQVDAGIYLSSEVWPIKQDDPCVFAPDGTILRTASEMVAYLEGLPGLAPIQAEAVTIGGLSGYRLDLSIDPTWTDTCPFSQGQPVRPIYGDGDPSEDGFSWNAGPGAPMRNWFLDLGRNRSLWIDIEAPDSATYDGLIDEATAIVESMEFTPPE